VREYESMRYEDEPPDRILSSKGDYHSSWCPGDTMKHVRRLLLWRGTLLHRSGRSMRCAQALVALMDGYIWFWVLENMRDKMAQRKGGADDKSGAHAE
jgi:hypothetical protein